MKNKIIKNHVFNPTNNSGSPGKIKIVQHNYTLMEMLFVIGLTAVLLNAATSFYFKGRDITRKYTGKAVQIRTASVVTRYWRDFVHKNGKPFMVKPDKVVFENKSAISINKNKLTFRADETEKTVTLSKKYTATFELENNKNEAPLLVLYLRPIGTKNQTLKDKFIRITASTGGVKP